MVYSLWACKELDMTEHLTYNGCLHQEEKFGHRERYTDGENAL